MLPAVPPTTLYKDDLEVRHTPKLQNVLRHMAIFRKHVKPFVRTIGRAASNYAASAIGRSAVRYGSKLARLAVKKAGGAMPTMFRIGTNESPVVTYKAKGRKLNRRQRKFARRVLEVVNGISPLQTYIHDNCGGVKTITADQVLNDSVELCSLTTGSSNDDIRQCFYSAYTLASDAACAGYKLQFRSAVMDVNWTNTGSGGVVLDVYVLLCRKSYTSASTNVDVQFTSQFAEQAGTVSVTNVAVTPFQNPGFLQFWKIMSHKTVHLKTGEVCNMQIRQNKRKWLDGKMLTQAINGVPGWTKAIFFQMRGEVENNAGTARFSGGTLCWKARKTYSYQFPADRNRTSTVEA